MKSLLAIVLFMSAVQPEQKAAWNQMPHSPADGTTIKVNPPPFTWVPPEDSLTYVLEVDDDSSFSSPVVQRTVAHVSTVSLHAPLTPGSYCWRYGIHGAGGVTYSRVRRFMVPADAQLWPRPVLEEMIKRVPVLRPRLFVRPEAVAFYRDRAADGDLQQVLAAIQRQCAGHLNEELVPEPPPVLGAGAERGRNYSAIIRATRPPMDLMESFALAYLLTNDPVYGLEAKRRLLYFFSWNPEGTTSWLNNDEPAMWIMMRGVRAYDWTYPLFTAGEREAVESVMRVRAAQFYYHLRHRQRFHTDPFVSHSGRMVGFLGETALAFIHEWPEARDWLDYVTTIYWNIYPAWGKEDGGWHEGPSYWSAYMNFALHFAVALKNATAADLLEKPFLRNTPYYLLYSNPPYAKISPFGDGESSPAGTGHGATMFAFASLLGDPYMKWYAEACGVTVPADILGVVLSRDVPESKAPLDLPQARYFPGVGLVSLHTSLGHAEEDVHFLIHSDPYGPVSHAHADQNAFTLEAFGADLAIASGYYPWYNSNHHSQWQWESKSSNTITFNNGIGQVKRDARSAGRIVHFLHTDTFDYVEADATQAYQGRLKECVRQVVHVRPGVFVMLDRVSAPEPVTFEWRLHANSPIVMNGDGLLISRQKATLEVHFYSPEDLKFTLHEGAEPPPEREAPVQYYALASTAKPTRSANYLSVLVPKRCNGTPKVTIKPLTVKGGIGLQLSLDGVESLVAFNTGGQILEAAGVTTQGPVLAVRLDAGGAPAAHLSVEQVQ